MNTPPSVVELYAEPSAFTWNMFRRVVKGGEYVVFHMFFDQPVSKVRLWIGDHATIQVVRHENIAPAYQVYKPCAGGGLDNWLRQKGLVALTETFTKPTTGFDEDDDFLDATINGNFNSRVEVGSDSVPCSGFWVLKGGSGGYRVKRLCARRKILMDAPGVTVDATCADVGDRVYISTAGHNYHTARVTLTDAMLDNSNGNQPDGPIRVKWQLMSAWDGSWGASETASHSATDATTGFFGRAQTTSNDVADVTSRVGPAFDPANSCNRDAVVNYDQPGSSVWVAVDSTPPTTLIAANIVVTLDSAQASTTALVAARGDIITVVVTYDEQIDPNDAFSWFTTGSFNRRLTPSLVYYNVVTYELVVGTTIPALDALMELTFGPVSDVVQNAQASGFVANTFANSVTVTTQSRASTAALPQMWSAGYDTGFVCTTTSNNALNSKVVGPGHTFTLVLTTSTTLSLASAVVAGVTNTDAGVTVVIDNNGGTDNRVTVTRTVPSTATPTDGDGFVDGSSVNWKLSLVTTTTCLDGTTSPLCAVAFDVTACPSLSATFTNGVPSAWEDRIYVDVTPPTLTSLRMVSVTNPTLGAVVRDTESATVTFVSSEPLLYGGSSTLPAARLLVKDCGPLDEATADLTIAAVTPGSGVAANTYTLAFTGASHRIGTVTVGSAITANCQTSQLCLDFVTTSSTLVTDTAGNPLSTTQYCVGFGDLLTRREPGWLLYDNMAAPTSVVVAKVPHACADSSVNAPECAADSLVAATHPGSWFTVTMTASTPTALSSVSFGAAGSLKEHVSKLPRAGDSFVLNGCTDAAPVARCEAFASRRGACEAFMCPACEWRHSCDASCGYCQTGLGAGTSAVLTLATSEFPGLAAGTSLVVSADVRTTGKDSGTITVTSSLAYEDFTPGLAATTSCAGRCGGEALSGCGCDASCVIDGDCCADAGLCCAVNADSPSAGAVNVAGGCLLPPALALTTVVTHWSVRSDGVVGTLASPGSTVYLLVTANKPIDVSRVTIGGAEGTY